jgi:NAD(P)-dependent dehydrogenase (short-subunit alcohol dehydrogenase family)
MKTILITGASSGIGRATAQFFAQKGWNVAATMRKPENDQALNGWPNLKKYALDVTQPDSIAQAVAQAHKDFGGIDVVVNNAGYGALGIFEKSDTSAIRRQLETNVIGLMEVCRAILPYFRQQRGGTIINISSVGGRVTFPLYSVYHATKWAVEGFSESLQYEVKPWNIRVKLVEPGAIKTDFYDRSQDLFQQPGFEGYDSYEKSTFAATQKAGADAPGPEVVARKIWQAANHASYRMRYPAGPTAAFIIGLHQWFPRLYKLLIGSLLEPKKKS